ncbi:RIC1-domain-containing protein [Gilbertella persicaria]|uniref:RIC1-domain-containing protein n=1 Tax=Gilbertella persicaria TaxID=101096 RepID=UPI00221E700B|nr:RIC1-domain-containing protein [Gilbertella persicaria]KAI8087829.1 RIC1-domain-containing protein [Gilbertella persicaria]
MPAIFLFLLLNNLYHMYWLNGIASQLSLECTTRKDENKTFPHSLNIVSIQPSHHASLYITCTRSAIYLWSVKPSTVLAFVERADNHISEFGENIKAIWKPDASAIVVHTANNYLLLYSIISYDQRTFEFNFPHSSHAYVTGPGEGKGPKTMLIKFRLAIRVDAGIICGTSSEDTLIIATKSPAAIQCISWNPQQMNATQTALIDQLGIMENETTEQITQMVYDKSMHVSVWISNEGKAYFVQNNSALLQERLNNSHELTTSHPQAPSFGSKVHWTGVCFHQQEATFVSINPKLSLIAVGTTKGSVYVYSASNYATTPTLLHTLELTSWASQSSSIDNSVQSLEWTSDGYAIAVGFKRHGLAVWSMYGGLLCSSSEMDDFFSGDRLKDTYVKSIHTLFWGPGNHQLYVLSSENSTETKLFTIPFAKSALTSYLHSDNARRGLIQTDDRILLYNNGGDYQENNNTIDPAAVAWTHIQYPALYITDHWPIRYASISPDGKYIAIAGKRGFTHYNSISNRWKLFGNQHQEQSFLVRGGMVWFKHVLILGCELIQQKTYEIRLYSRDTNLDNAYLLCSESLDTIPVYMALCGQFLIVYTSDNMLTIYHVGVGATPNNSSNGRQMSPARLDMVKRISLKDIVARISRVRSISLFHAVHGDQLKSVEHVLSSNIILLVDGKLLMLCPKVLDENDTSDLVHDPSQLSANQLFDIHIIHHQAEYYWIGKKRIENLITSLWIADGKGLKVCINLLLSKDFDYTAFENDESEPSTPTTPGVLSSSSSARNFDIGKPYSLGYRIGSEPLSPSASMADVETYTKWIIHDFDSLSSQAIYIPLDFYPLSILLDKGIIVGIEQNISYRDSLGFVLFKMSPKMHLFLHHILRYLLQRELEEEAVIFARAYEKFVYFSHALEILLHTVLEEEAGHNLGKAAILPLVIKFLDQFPHALDVIVSCARKTEVALWDHLFSVVGKPKDLFELCLADGRLRTATSYLIILQTMQPLAIGGKDTIRLLEKSLDENDYELCKELLRFLSSIDNTGKTLQDALKMVKTRVESENPLSPNSKDAQVEKVAQSMSNLSST